MESVARAGAQETPESPPLSPSIDLARTILSVFPEPPHPQGFYARRGKAVFDRLVALLLLLPAAPLMAVIALAIKLDSRGAVFLRQKRVGLGGAVFPMLKFRSMVDGAEKDSGPVWAQPGDPRITRVGRFLRLYRLDELLQLINVLRGEMSLVGPRPERPVFSSSGCPGKSPGTSGGTSSGPE